MSIVAILRRYHRPHKPNPVRRCVWRLREAAATLNGRQPPQGRRAVPAAVEGVTLMRPSELGQTGQLGDRLATGRRQRFVGRASELDLVRSALAALEPPFAVLHVYGPGGIGKTTLLGEFARLSEELGRAVVRLDGRSIEASPPGVTIALGSALGLGEDESPLEALARLPQTMLLIDTYEALTPVTGWLRERFLPQLPAQSLTVIDGRMAPDSAWRTDPGWQGLVQILPLRNLLPDESRAYLTGRQVPAARHAGILAATHGHPLALSLLADAIAQGQDVAAEPLADQPDVVRVLLERFVEHLPSARHRHALEIAAHVRVLTESLLGELLGEEDAHALFSWMRGLSFIEQGRDGLFPHDLAREVLEADLRWRDPARFHALHREVRAPIVRQLHESRGLAQQRAFFDLLYLHRHSPVMRPSHDWGTLGQAHAAPAGADDLSHILELVTGHEGAESAAIARHWQERQPDAFLAFRGRAGAVVGFAAHLALHDATPEDRAADPAVVAAWDFAERRGPPRAGEEMVYHRFAMDRERYQAPSPSMDLMAMTSMLQWLSRPRLAWSFLAIADPAPWHAVYTYLNFRRVPEADFTVGGGRYAVYAHDWRVEPVLAWLDAMSERELATEAELPLTPAEGPAPQIVLSRADFADAVRQALRDYARPSAHGANPLLRSRLVREATGPDAAAEALQAVLRAAAETLTRHPKDQRLYRALRHTYLQPIGTQEAVAERLDLPFSTYRYHLATAIERVTETLWQQELGEPK